jgi:hypothetical protein
MTKLITTPIQPKEAASVYTAARLTPKQAETLKHLGGAAWLRAQLDVIAAMKARKA